MHSRAVFPETRSIDVSGFGIAVLLLWRKCNPQLISLDAGHSDRAAAVPYTTTCVHPFDASLINDSFGTQGFLIRQLSLKDDRHYAWPRSEGLTSRVIGPCEEPRVQRTISRSSTSRVLTIPL